MKIEVKNFNLKETLLSGQCFRIKENNGYFTTIYKDRVLVFHQDGNTLFVESNNNNNLEQIVKNYLDLNRDYDKINNALRTDSVMNGVINKSIGYKIMNQDSFEMCISYIISQNNNVKRISSSIEKICIKYGKEIEYKKNLYYLFPTYEEIKDAKIEDLRATGIGFRDKYIIDFLEKYPKLMDLNNLSTIDALNELMTVKGIGLKVSSCILLFGYSRLDVFPIDTWVKQFISGHYNIKNDQKTIEEFSKAQFKDYSGLAIQYMFNSERNLKK